MQGTVMRLCNCFPDMIKCFSLVVYSKSLIFLSRKFNFSKTNIFSMTIFSTKGIDHQSKIMIRGYVINICDQKITH